MDTSFDLVALLKQQPATKKSHKIRPTQFVSVAGGVQKRLEINIKNRKSSRLSVFDRIRNISKCESPKPQTLSDAQQKALHRKQQLEKWKEEKEKKKKEAASQKKKPFVAGVAQRKSFGPPPPPPKPMPGTSGRVTRSQARPKPEPKPTQAKSFAPSNATFKPSLLLSTEVPTLAPVNKKKTSKPKPNITFDPVLPKNLQKETRTTRTMRPRPVVNKPVVDNKKKPTEKTKAKKTLKAPPLKQQMFQSSSSSSDMEQPSKQRSKPNLRKSITKKVEKPVTVQEASLSSPDAPLSQDAVSMSSQDSQDAPMSQDAVSMSSQDSQDAPMSQDAVSMSSQDSQDDKLSQDTVSMLSQDSQDAELSQDTVSMSSPDSQDAKLSQDSVSMSSPDSQDAKLTQDSVSMSSQDELSTPRNKVPKSESSSEEKLRAPENVGIQLTPEQIAEEVKNISPCVTLSRGKANARKEMKKKFDEGLFDEDNSNMGSVNHFRRQLNSEIVRITALCDTWDQIVAQTVLPEPVEESVRAAVGQARLLVAQKMQQFSSLVEQCARPVAGASLVTPADLQGFWDMVFIQVQNVNTRFMKLDKLRLRDWIEEPKPVEKKAVAKPAAKKAAAKPKGGPSRLREMIAAARAAKKVQESQSENSESEKSEPATCPETKTFEAGFFRISSPVRASPAPATPSNKPSLLKTVLSSEAKKSVTKTSASFAMLRASLMSKNVEIDGVSPLMLTPTVAPVNLDATPARSILKQNNPVSTKKTDKLKTVLFHENNTEPSSPASYVSCDKEPGIAPLPADDKENVATPKTSTRKSRLSRQNTEQHSPVMTRSRRKSTHTPLLDAHVHKSTHTPLLDVHADKSTQTPLLDAHAHAHAHDNTRSARGTTQTPLESDHNANKKRSTRKQKDTHTQQETETPKRSTRRRKSAIAV